MTKSRGIGRGGARNKSGRKEINSISTRFSLHEANVPKLAKWKELGFKNKSDFINICISVFVESIK